MRVAPVTCAIALLSSLAAPSARADITKDHCIEANGKGQDLQHDGKLRAARVQLLSCAQASCPAILRNDCAKRLDELDRVQPAIVFETKDPAGNDVGAVRVTMDGAPFAERLDGTPLRADPGEHVFVFTSPGRDPLTRRLVLVERDVARRERVVLELPAAPTQGPAPASPLPASASASGTNDAGSAGASPGGMSATRVLGLVAGGVGVAGIGVGSVFGLMTGSAWNKQKADCASSTSCPNHAQAVSDHATVGTDGTIATVGFVAGGALLAAGVVLFLAGGSSQEARPSTGLIVVPALAPGGAGLSLQRVF
jgi:hypothetical protein